jgi:hypothetical protein
MFLFSITEEKAWFPVSEDLFFGSSDISRDIVIGKEGNRCFLYICSDQTINTKDEQQFPISRLGSLFPEMYQRGVQR